MRGPIREEQRSTTNVVLCAPYALTIVRDQSELGTLLSAFLNFTTAEKTMHRA